MNSHFRCFVIASSIFLIGTVLEIGYFRMEAKIALAANQNTATVQKNEVDSREDEDNGKEPKQKTDAERILQLKETIKRDTQRLKELAENLKRLEDGFKRHGNQLTDLKSRIVQQKETIANAVEEGDARKTAQLQTELDRLEAEYQQFNKESDLVLKGSNTLREQIKALKEKIEKTALALNRLKGTEPSTEKSKPAVSTKPSKQPEKESSEAAQLIPQDQATAKPTKISLEGPSKESKLGPTAEQLEAQELVADKKQDAERAAKTVVDTVKRKKAIQKEMELAEKMLQTYRAGAEVLQSRLKKLEEELDQKIETGEDKTETTDLRQRINDTRTKLKRVRAEVSRGKQREIALKRELEEIQQEQLQAVKKAEKERAEAETAIKRKVWLESPFHPNNILRWVVVRGPKLLEVLIAMALLLLLVKSTSHRLAGMIVRQSGGTEEERKNRARTLGTSFRSALSGVVIIGGILLLLEEAGLSIKTLLGGAAVMGLTIAFGAQNLMRDYFSGFMILVEGQFKLNDVVKIGNFSGTVERMTLRMTTLRDLEGRAHFIPNGQIKGVTNMTHKWSQVLVDIPVTYRADVDRVMTLLMEIADDIRKDDEYKQTIIEEPIMLGVDFFAESGVVIKMLLKTLPGKQWALKRELLRRVKYRFDNEGIEIPVPHRVVYHRNESNPG